MNVVVTKDYGALQLSTMYLLAMKLLFLSKLRTKMYSLLSNLLLHKTALCAISIVFLQSI